MKYNVGSNRIITLLALLVIGSLCPLIWLLKNERELNVPVDAYFISPVCLSPSGDKIDGLELDLRDGNDNPIAWPGDSDESAVLVRHESGQVFQMPGPGVYHVVSPGVQQDFMPFDVRIVLNNPGTYPIEIPLKKGPPDTSSYAP